MARLMARLGVVLARDRAVPRGWLILGLAVAAWAIVWALSALIF